MANNDTHSRSAESADMREVYRRLAERHADELRKHDELCPECDSDRDRYCLRKSGSGVEGR